MDTEVGEYSISAVGPGPRARRLWKVAKEQELKTIAEVQVNNTWELSAIPYLPVMHLVARSMPSSSHCCFCEVSGLVWEQPASKKMDAISGTTFLIICFVLLQIIPALPAQYT
ncbi:MAG: hypothetical protein U9R60_00690 [Bacteroidota bacterium]|nr:hypothetical protein [Bacteroidota bacterium]